MARIRFTADPKLPRDLAHLGYKKGDEVALTDDQASRWLRRGVAEVLPDEPAKRRRGDRDLFATLLGSSTLPGLVEIGEDKVQLGTIVQAAFERSGLDVESWNALSDEDRDATLAAEILEMKAAAAAPPEIPEDWQSQHHTARIALARKLTQETVNTASDADKVIAAEVERRATPETPPQV